MESYYKPNPRWPGVPHHTQADPVFHFQGTLPKAAADTGEELHTASSAPCSPSLGGDKRLRAFLIELRVFITS